MNLSNIIKNYNTYRGITLREALTSNYLLNSFIYIINNKKIRISLSHSHNVDKWFSLSKWSSRTRIDKYSGIHVSYLNDWRKL